MSMINVCKHIDTAKMIAVNDDAEKRKKKKEENDLKKEKKSQLCPNAQQLLQTHNIKITYPADGMSL